MRRRPRGDRPRGAEQPRLARIVATPSAVLPFPIKGGKLWLYNNNPLLRLHYPGIDGVKTGYTVAAGPCLVASARRGHQWLGVVLLHSDDLRSRRRSCSTPASRRAESECAPARRSPAGSAPAEVSTRSRASASNSLSSSAGAGARTVPLCELTPMHAQPRQLAGVCTPSAVTPTSSAPAILATRRRSRRPHRRCRDHRSANGRF